MANLELSKFNTACDELIAGKYILANIKIKNLINTINQNEQLTSLISSSLDNFDFDMAFKSSVTPSGLQPPIDDKSVIAYCFNILYNLDVGTISILDFLSKYFSSAKTSGGEEFKMFVNTIVFPLKKAVNNQYAEIIKEDEQDIVPQDDLCYKLVNVAQANIANLDEIRLKQIEKEELELLLNAMIEAGESNNKNLIYAVMVGLEYFVKSNKRAKGIYLQLKDCFTIN